MQSRGKEQLRRLTSAAGAASGDQAASRSSAFLRIQDDGSDAAPREPKPSYAPALGSAFLFCRFFTRSSTTVGSASVEVSPRLPDSSSAILRRIRRMILPERVFGRPGAN